MVYTPLMLDESPEGHGPHRMSEDADRRVIDVGRGTKYDDPLLCSEVGRCLCHGLLPPPTLCERRYRGLARRFVAVRRRATLMMPEGEHPRPRRSYRCRRSL
jgi:hypothetical protein